MQALSLIDRFLLVALLLGMLTSTTTAADATAKTFSIPAGSAVETFKAFATQSGQQLIYSGQAVKDVRTHAVEGRFTPRRALEQMLAGTQLVVTEDEHNGALAVNRVDDPNAERAVAATGNRPQQSSAAEPKVGEETVELSPFEVVASTNSGYLATETLSGTRLRSQVRDLSNSMTVMTDEFLDDVGAIDFYDALEHAPSTAGFQADSGDNQGNSLRFNTNYRVRGFRLSSLSIDFFQTGGGGGGVPIDRYNTESLTLARGPNSILYGISSPGGVINVSSKKGVLGASITELELRAASHDSYRVALDVNRELVPGKAALRVDVLDQDLKDFRGTRNLRKAAYGSLLVRPFQKLSVYLNYENGTLDRHVARPVIVYDYYTPWVEAGKPIDTTPGNGTGNLAGLDVVNNGNYLVYIPGQSEIPIMNWRRMTMGALPRNPVTAATESQVSLTDPSIMPLTIDLAGPHDENSENYSILENLWELQPLPNLFLEVGAFREERRHVLDAETIRNADKAIRVDTNAFLPNGDVNPNVGRPYVEATSFSDKHISSLTHSEYRVSADYDLDLTNRHLGGFDLGFHRLLGLWSYSEQVQIYDTLNLVNTTPLSGFSGLLNNVQNRIHTRTYLDLGGSADQHILGDFQPFSQDGVNADYVRGGGAPRNTRDTVESKMAAVQSYFLNRRLVTVVGIRRDESSAASASFPRNLLGLYGDPAEATRDPAFTFSGDTTALGAVYHLTDQWSLSYNRSKSFTPPDANAVSVADQLLPATTALGQDFGVKFDLFKSRLTGSLVYFDTQAEGQIINTSLARGNKTAWVNGIWDAIDPSREITYAAWRDTEDFKAKGWELQLIANPTSRWRMALAASRNQNTLLAYIPFFQQYFAQNRGIWESPENVDKPVADSTGGATVGEVVHSIENQLGQDLAQIGSNVIGQSEYLVDFTTNYTLPDFGAVHNIHVGGNYHWESPRVIGYGTDASGVTTSAKEFRGRARSTFSAWVGFRLPCGHKRSWSLQLNVRNVFNEQHLQPFFAEQGIDGPLYTAQILEEPRSWILTSTFEF